MLWYQANGSVGSSTYSSMVFVDKKQFDIIVKHTSLIIIGIAHVLPHSI